MAAPSDSDNNFREFAGRLCSLMDDVRMTVRQASEVSGASYSTVQGWRTGSAPRDFFAVRKLAKGLGVSLSYLLTGEEEGGEAQPPPYSQERSTIPSQVLASQVASKVLKARLAAGAAVHAPPLNPPVHKLTEQLALSRYRDEIAFRREMEDLLSVCAMAVTSSRSGIAISDAIKPDNPLIFVNHGFERLTGYSASEVIGRNCRFLQGDDRDQKGVKEMAQAIRDGRDAHVLLRNYKKDGTPFWNEVFLSPVFDAQGVISNYVSVQIDATDRKPLPGSEMVRSDPAPIF